MISFSSIQSPAKVVAFFGLVFLMLWQSSMVAASTNLVGTRWNLVSVQSMDDSKGTIQIDQSKRFTLHFDEDGKVNMKLDCNRGTGSWKTQASGANSQSGHLTFGKIAATRALCPDSNLNEQVVKDLGFVRSYLLKDGFLYLSLMADGGIYKWAPVDAECSGAACNTDQKVVAVKFAKGASSAVLAGSIRGYQYVDYQLQAGAGQTMKVSMKSKNKANYFNVLPPNSADVAMFNSQFSDSFNGVLPDDGVYTIRVYLMRSAARRNEESKFSLEVKVTGKPLVPLSNAEDSTLPQSRFHASAPGACLPYLKDELETCEYGVVRRGRDGTATVEVKSSNNLVLKILFVKGVPVAADTFRAIRHSKAGDVTTVWFDANGERYEINDVLLVGG